MIIIAIRVSELAICNHSYLQICSYHNLIIVICDLPRENRPSSHLVMIVEIPILKFFNWSAFARVRLTISGITGHNGLLAFL